MSKQTRRVTFQSPVASERNITPRSTRSDGTPGRALTKRSHPNSSSNTVLTKNPRHHDINELCFEVQEENKRLEAELQKLRETFCNAFVSSAEVDKRVNAFMAKLPIQDANFNKYITMEEELLKNAKKVVSQQTCEDDLAALIKKLESWQERINEIQAESEAFLSTLT